VRWFSTKDCSTNYFTRRVKTERYKEIIEQFIAMLNDERYCWLEQDGATAHAATSSMHTPWEFFEAHVTSRGIWSPQPRDLSHPDFLRCYLNENVYMNNTH
jgi:hypothetical protein